MVENLFKNKYYLVTYRYDGTKYRVVAPSKRKLTKMLPRLNWSPEVWAERKHTSRKFYHIWTIKEIDEKKYMKMSQIVNELILEYTYENIYET